MFTDRTTQQSSNQEMTDSIIENNANPLTPLAPGNSEGVSLGLQGLSMLDLGLEALQRAADANIPGISQLALEKLQNLEKRIQKAGNKGQLMLPKSTGAEMQNIMASRIMNRGNPPMSLNGQEDLIREMNGLTMQGSLHDLGQQTGPPLKRIGEVQKGQEDLVESMGKLMVQDSQHSTELQQPVPPEARGVGMQNMGSLPSISPVPNGSSHSTSPGSEDMFTPGYILAVADMLEDILQSNYTNFERDFEQWFNSEDTIPVPGNLRAEDHGASFAHGNLGAEDINFERDFGQWFNQGDTMPGSGNVRNGEINFERDFGQWYSADVTFAPENLQMRDIDFERDFGQWFSPEDATLSTGNLQNPVPSQYPSEYQDEDMDMSRSQQRVVLR